MLTQICYELYDADEYRDFVKHVVKQFRGSPEYSMWLNSFNRNECAATGLTRDADGVPIEVHHFRIHYGAGLNISLTNFIRKIYHSIVFIYA